MRLFKKLPIKKSALLSFLLFFLFSGAALAGATLEIPLPGMPTGADLNPASYIRTLFIISYSLIGFLAVAIIVWGGILYSIPGKTSQAKQMILGALSGIVLLFSSYLILYTIDPTLTELLPGNIQNLEPITINPPEEYVSVKWDADSAEAKWVNEGESPLFEKLRCLAGDLNQYICDDLKKQNTLTDNLKNLPVAVTITETTRNHGCFNVLDDPCTEGAACGSSDHCKGTAVDIRISDQEAANIEKIMESLSKSKCVSDLFYAGFPEYCKNNGGTARTDKDSACMTHKNHIHYSVNLMCQ